MPPRWAGKSRWPPVYTGVPSSKYDSQRSLLCAATWSGELPIESARPGLAPARNGILNSASRSQYKAMISGVRPLSRSIALSLETINESCDSRNAAWRCTSASTALPIFLDKRMVADRRNGMKQLPRRLITSRTAGVDVLRFVLCAFLFTRGAYRF